MRKHAWAALAALLLGLSVSATAARADENTLARTRQQTFVVEVCEGQHAVSIGSGVVVARDADTLTLATAQHVVAQRGDLRILDESRGAYYSVVGIHFIVDYDLALIRVRAQPLFPVQPARIAAPAAGESVWVWGNTGDGFWELADGTISSTNEQIPGLFGSPRIAIECARCARGDSGSGVFDSQGRLVGILTRAWRKTGSGSVLFIEVEPAALVAQEALADR